MDIKKHLENRSLIARSLAGEIFGPDSSLHENNGYFSGDVDETDNVEIPDFESWDEFNKYKEGLTNNGIELLEREPPSSKYGVGILFSKSSDESNEAEETTTIESHGVNEIDSEEISKDVLNKQNKLKKELLDKAEVLSRLSDDVASDDNVDLRLSNISRPRSMGISFIADLSGEGQVSISLQGGRYRPVEVSIKNPEKENASLYRMYLRHRVKGVIDIDFDAFLQSAEKNETITIGTPNFEKPIKISFRALSRPVPKRIRESFKDIYSDNCRLITVSVVNVSDESPMECNLYQSRLTITPHSEDESLRILEYPRPFLSEADDETQSFELLYRKEKIFSTGHGCAGDWNAMEFAERAESVTAELLPHSETPQFTPNLMDGDSKLEIKIAPLAGLIPGDDGIGSISRMLELYDEWIDSLKSEKSKLPQRFQNAASRHISDCEVAISRMRKGLELIKSNSKAALAFKLANKAMLVQQMCGALKKRDAKIVDDRMSFDPPFEAPDSDEKLVNSERSWRPFQIAFILMNISPLFDPNDEDREVVELIWFPTGGGKTEAYLGASAFSLFVRRLLNPEDTGTEIIMRYTLRLLTAQQFQRASALICAMEKFRRQDPETLGEKPFSIGMWVGGETTPNSVEDAKRNKFPDTERRGSNHYAMVLLKCPWCGCEMGPVKRPDSGAGGNFTQLGVRKRDAMLHCPDPRCLFNDQLPVWVIDEHLYKERPSVIIGTVDKFAQLAWRPEARSLFGIEEDGTRETSPPRLIIQDELHLITGPLGSMVGLYETLVEELCTDRRTSESGIRPKIVCATATTRASDRQIKDLFGRDKASIFPSPGLDSDDSFFAQYDRESTGERKPGRLYVGILPVNYNSSLTSTVRSSSAILAAVNKITSEEYKDPWWTLLLFYNSLRELGGGLTLFASDIRERLFHLCTQWHNRKSDYRWVNNVVELTGRLSNSEIPQALEKLERKASDKYPVDACLASNIIEVGVDVGRLGIMGVMGQPKTSAQYIQATGRVGRSFPGMVFTQYGTQKPRDRSYYEQFKSYHTRLYSQVEPSSVTPFSRPLLDRAAHAVLCAWVRQLMPIDQIGTPKSGANGSIPMDELKNAIRALVSRQKKLSASLDRNEMEVRTEKEVLVKKLQEITSEWKSSDANCWQNHKSDDSSGDKPLIRMAGSACKQEWIEEVWSTPNSMRGVDFETQPVISVNYKNPTEDDDEDDFFQTL